MTNVKNTVKRGVNIGFVAFFNYETQKIVQINSLRIGIINRIIQLLVIAYIIGYVLVYEKGYQSTDIAISGVITKVKGVSYVNSTDLPEIYNGVWDVQDIVVPPLENNAFFVTTNLIITKRQTRSACPEDPNIPDVNCTSNSDCERGRLILLGHGALTGRCVNATDETKGKVCEVYAWCDIEDDELISKKKPLFDNVPNFTVLIKNSIEFPHFNVKRRNILESYTNQQLQTCSDDSVFDPHCPVIRLDTIFRQAGVEYQQIGIEGAVIGIHIDWDCNLDRGEDNCNPTYSFRRVDSPTTKIAKGWNYRYTVTYYENGTEYRDLYKAYGIRFLVFVEGKAGKFDVIPLTMNVGSGMGLLGVATLLCDMIVLYCMRKRDKYRYAKYQNIKDDDALKGLISESTQGLLSESAQDDQLSQFDMNYQIQEQSSQYGGLDQGNFREIVEVPEEVTEHQ